jgi:hypothetical protein
VVPVAPIITGIIIIIITTTIQSKIVYFPQHRWRRND